MSVPCCSADYSALSYTDRQCGNDSANLWLDVVVVVDNSQGMTSNGLTDIASNIGSVFAQSRIGTTNYLDPRTTRVALVTYNSDSYTNADLNQFQSTGDLFNNVFSALATLSSTDQSYLETGLSTAEQLLKAGKNQFNRAHFKRVVIVYASAYEGEGERAPMPVADRLKGDGVKIITVAYDQRGDGALLDQLAKIASPRMNFTNNRDLVPQVQGALYEANCFCPDDWVQYRQTFGDVTSQPYGTCIQPVGLTAVWQAAKLGCANRRQNTFLVNEYTPHKHNFVLKSASVTSGFSQPWKYHIGLNWRNGNWTWDQPTGWPQPVLQQWYNWIQGYPVSSSSMSGCMNVQSGFGTGWKNIALYTESANYVCETASCDTDNYCATNV
ncbi:hypothetical protein CRE_03438 [Caenorhabditis remanei]|uniref:VWFA domain-containing protein n=1 Tax=Caenorhabditis remanei TaxID=31234 RepID=E3NE44_CAERE|nr:hypothetical protein CRE_03438 [Caenorhabditis remanei]